MNVRFSEDAYAEQPALEWLTLLGWDHLDGSQIAPGTPAAERSRWEEVVLTERLRSAIVQLNPRLSSSGAQLVIDAVLTPASPVVVADHEAFHEFLTSGVPLTYLDDQGEAQSIRARLVDFEHWDQNDFVAVSQLTVINGQKNRRPDVVLFINGLPLGQLELKRPDQKAATAERAANQVAHYGDTIPQLYRFVEIIGVSDLFEARVGTTSTPPEHFAEWRSMDLAEDEGRSALEVMIRGVFSPARFLDLVQNFVLFETDGARVRKVLAKYHQVDAVNRAVEATAEAMSSDGRAGVVWHTQGAGKSYTMVFYVGKVRRDRRFGTPTIVAVTDRLDLDDQLRQTFESQSDLAPAVKHAESIDELHALLDVPAGDIVFTTIQKFQPPAGASEMPVVSGRHNVIVIADEAHRTQYAQFAENITTALPHATRIGFTGTPIEMSDRSTRLVFGDYVSVYRMSRAIEDGATVPIYYESRRIPVGVEDENLLEEVEDVLSGEEDEAASKLVTSWAKLERVVGAPDRLDRLAADIAEHWHGRTEVLAGKALVVGMSQLICAELTERLEDYLGDDVVTCVISAQASDEPLVSRWRRSSAERRQVEANFKDPDHPLQMVVVRDMWLTGFDAPPLHTLYVDKPMRDHGLLQAIARVNRVFRDKPGGLVVDYIGIGDDLRKSLRAYSEEIVDESMIPLAVAVAKLREKHEIVRDFFHGLDFRGRHVMTPSARANLLVRAHSAVVEDEETKTRFLREQALFNRWFALVSPHTEALELRDDAEFFGAVAGSVRKYTPLAEQASIQAQQVVSQFFSEALAAGEIVDIFDIAGHERPEISILSDNFLDEIVGHVGSPQLGIGVLKKLLNDEIRVRQAANNMQARLFGEALNDLLTRYERRQLQAAEVLERLVELAKQVRAARRRHEALGLLVEEAAFYDALADDTQSPTADPKTAEISQALVSAIRGDLSVDWADREATEAAIRVKIKRLLRRYGFKAEPTGGAGRLERATDLVLDQARTLYRNWPHVASGMDALL